MLGLQQKGLHSLVIWNTNRYEERCEEAIHLHHICTDSLFIKKSMNHRYRANQNPTGPGQSNDRIHYLN